MSSVATLCGRCTDTPACAECVAVFTKLTHLVRQSCFGGNSLGSRVVRPQIGTVVLKGIIATIYSSSSLWVAIQTPCVVFALTVLNLLLHIFGLYTRINQYTQCPS